jgi:hypothetical protein
VPGGGLQEGRRGLADHVPIAGWLAAGRGGTGRKGPWPVSFSCAEGTWGYDAGRLDGPVASLAERTPHAVWLRPARPREAKPSKSSVTTPRALALGLCSSCPTGFISFLQCTEDAKWKPIPPVYWVPPGWATLWGSLWRSNGTLGFLSADLVDAALSDVQVSSGRKAKRR